MYKTFFFSNNINSILPHGIKVVGKVFKFFHTLNWFLLLELKEKNLNTQLSYYCPAGLHSQETPSQSVLEDLFSAVVDLICRTLFQPSLLCFASVFASVIALFRLCFYAPDLLLSVCCAPALFCSILPCSELLFCSVSHSQRILRFGFVMHSIYSALFSCILCLWQNK